VTLVSWRPKWQNFRERDWDEIRNHWLSHIPNFPAIGAGPDPGLDELNTLQEINIPSPHGRFADVAGLRSNTLWESVFLFHKCSHTNLAAQRLAQSGMHSWCLFNAYHSAYLGARGVMAMLGVALPKLKSTQIAIDLCPEPLKKKRHCPVGSLEFGEFLIVPLQLLEQRYLWEAFQRVLRMTNASCWDLALRQELLALSYGEITPPRNQFLYRADFWPLADLTSDIASGDLMYLLGTELDTVDAGFLLRLSFSVYRLFEQLMSDLSSYSGVIKEQLDGARFLPNSELSELRSYNQFLAQIAHK
jgi:hypothetical protein